VSEQLGRYFLQSRLASGGMGEVYLARHTGPGGFAKAVVIKRILPHLAQDPDFIVSLVNEAQLAAQLQHPNIVQTFGLEHEASTWFVVMECVHGRSLRQVLELAVARGQGPLPARIAVGLVAEALRGLHFAHQLTDAQGRPLGILHRDVSPENLLVSFHGGVKLADFGIARAMTGAVTRVGRPKGKVAYMAPELTVSGSSVGPRADLYGAGVVLHELLCGELPPSVPTSVEALSAPRTAYRTNPALPAALDQVVSRALALQPWQRWTSAEAMGDALEAWLEASGGMLRPRELASFLLDLWGQEVVNANPAVIPLDPGVQGTLSRPLLAGTQPVQALPLVPGEAPGALRRLLAITQPTDHPSPQAELAPSGPAAAPAPLAFAFADVDGPLPAVRAPSSEPPLGLDGPLPVLAAAAPLAPETAGAAVVRPDQESGAPPAAAPAFPSPPLEAAAAPAPVAPRPAAAPAFESPPLPYVATPRSAAPLADAALVLPPPVQAAAPASVAATPSAPTQREAAPHEPPLAAGTPALHPRPSAAAQAFRRAAAGHPPAPHAADALADGPGLGDEEDPISAVHAVVILRDKLTITPIQLPPLPATRTPVPAAPPPPPRRLPRRALFASGVTAAALALGVAAWPGGAPAPPATEAAPEIADLTEEDAGGLLEGQATMTPTTSPAEGRATPSRRGRAWVVLQAPAGLRVTHLGRDLGVTPLQPVEVSPGTAVFVLKNPVQGTSKRRSVKVASGDTVVWKPDLSEP
jgi:serine/threonine-protein kinase